MVVQISHRLPELSLAEGSTLVMESSSQARSALSTGTLFVVPA